MQFKIFDLGLIEFKKAWNFQQEVFQDVKNSRFKSALILCQHYPVITLGRSGSHENILISENDLMAHEIEVFKVERGGDVTYHGPGQLTVYPIVDLNYFKKDIRWFLRKLEEIIAACLSDFGIKGQSLPGKTGVWINEQKIASIGIAIRSWVTFHGLSINVKKSDLSNFDFIRPCGMDIRMTALELVRGESLGIDKVKESIIKRFRDILLVQHKNRFSQGYTFFNRISCVPAGQMKAQLSERAPGFIGKAGVPLVRQVKL